MSWITRALSRAFDPYSAAAGQAPMQYENVSEGRPLPTNRRISEDINSEYATHSRQLGICPSFLVPGLRMRVICKWVDEREARIMREVPSVILAAPERRELLIPARDGNCKHAAVFESLKLSTILVTIDKVGIVKCPAGTVAVYKPEEYRYLYDELICPLCQNKGTVQAIDFRWVRSYKNFICGPCRDHLQEQDESNAFQWD